MPAARSEIKINRAPVLTLWAAVVAQRLGFKREGALTLGRAVAGLNAYSKGVSLGLFEPTPKEVREKRLAMRPKQTIANSYSDLKVLLRVENSWPRSVIDKAHIGVQNAAKSRTFGMFSVCDIQSGPRISRQILWPI